MAVAIMTELLGESEQLKMAACGTAFELEGVNPMAIDVLPSCKDVHRYPVDRAILRSTRLIITMERRQAKRCSQFLVDKIDRSKIYMLGTLAGKRGKYAEIIDPAIDGTFEEYKKCRDNLRILLEAAKEKILAMAKI